MSRRTKLTFIHKIKSLAVVTTCSTGFFVAINLYKGNEKFYNNILMPTMQYFDPELCHRFAILACKYHIFTKQKNPDPDNLKISLFGHQLNNPIGIAAGFDKQGEAINGLNRIGFGFIEIGSVTPEPQFGNPKPRVFRLTEDKAIINRYGFNSDGHEMVANRLNYIRQNNNNNNTTKFKAMLGVNLGKNKTSAIDSIEDYTTGIVKFSEFADYIVINISSPNTKGLRDLQYKNQLHLLLAAAMKVRNTLPIEQRRPILLKLAPDLSYAELKDIADIINNKECSIDGLIISNTTTTRDNTLKSLNSREDGGLSGAPLRSRSTKIIAEMYQLTKGKIPIIGVGGIFNGQDAYEKILAGASAIQLYTAFIYYGPPVINKIKNELQQLLIENGYSSVSEAVGKESKKYLSY